MSITIYTLPNCSQCEQTKRMMDRENLPYKTVDLATNPEAAKKISQLGYKTAPVVVTPTQTWSGFRLDRIRSEARAYQRNALHTQISGQLRTRTMKAINTQPKPPSNVRTQTPKLK